MVLVMEVCFPLPSELDRGASLTPCADGEITGRTGGGLCSQITQGLRDSQVLYMALAVCDKQVVPGKAGAWVTKSHLMSREAAGAVLSTPGAQAISTRSLC